MRWLNYIITNSIAVFQIIISHFHISLYFSHFIYIYVILIYTYIYTHTLCIHSVGIGFEVGLEAGAVGESDPAGRDSSVVVPMA